MTTSRHRFRVPLRSVALVLLAMACAAPAPPPPVLKRGTPVERELRGGQSHEYRLDLPAGWYARLRIEEPGRALSAVLLDPGAEVATESPRVDQEAVLSLVTARGGEHRLVVTPRDPKESAGRYRVLLQELRPARPADGRRVAAERAVAEGRRYGRVPATRRLAIRALSDALDVWRDIGDARGEVDTLNLLGPVYRQEGRTAEAIALYRNAAQRAGRIGYREGEALALNNLGYALHRDAKYGEAAANYRRSLALWARVGDAGEQCFLLQNLGQLHLDMGRLKEALAFYRQSLDIAPTDGDRATALGSVGLIQHYLGDHDRALGNLLRARQLSAAAADHGNGALIAATIGAIRYRRGEFRDALAAFEEALKGNPDPGTRAVVLQNQAPIFIDLGDLDRALASYQEAAALFAGLGNRRWEDLCHAGIGWVRQLQGDPQGALAEYERLAAQGPTYERALAYWSAGQPVRAAEILELSLPRARAAGELAHEGEIHLALGAAYRDLGRRRQARESLARAVEIGRRVESPGIVAAGLFRLAGLQRDAGRLDEALRDTEEALEVIESMRSRVAGRELKTSFFASRRAYYERAVDLLLRLDRQRPGRGYREAALAASERGRARMLLDLLTQAGIARDEARRWAGEAPTAPDAKTVAPRDSQPTTFLGFEEIRALLDGQTALLEYALGEDGSTLFVITRERLDVFPLPPAEAIDRKVEQLRRRLSRPRLRQATAYATEAHQLFQELIAPALSAIAGKSRLVIAPDQSLYLLPFEALLTEPAAGVPFEQMPYLLSRYTISYVPSASVLSTLRRPAPGPKPRRFVGFADPAPSPAAKAAARSSRGLEPLPAAIQEVTDIARILAPGEIDRYLGGQATEERVRHDPRIARARYLHFATHGLLDAKHPERSGLVLGRAPGDREDGFLQAFEVFHLDLAADLVVLSACDTGGEEVSGEGLVGLTQAFLYAGAPSVQVSLWSVADSPSAHLMADFYRELGWTDDKAGALRRAKLTMISSSRHAHPYYWAPFVLIGDPGDGQSPAVTFLADARQ